MFPDKEDCFVVAAHSFCVLSVSNVAEENEKSNLFSPLLLKIINAKIQLVSSNYSIFMFRTFDMAIIFFGNMGQYTRK